MANELMAQNYAAKEILAMVGSLDPKYRTTLFVVGILAGTYAHCCDSTMKYGYEFKWDRDGIRLFKPDAYAGIAAAS